MAEPGLVQVTKFSSNFTLLSCTWVPSSPRLAAVGSSLQGQGRLAVYALSGAGLTEVARGGGRAGGATRALRCSTFGGTGDSRHLVTGDFTGRLEVWDPEILAQPVDQVSAHDDLVNCVAGAAGQVVTGSRDGRVRAWDPRRLARSTASIEGEAGGPAHDCWAVAAGRDGHTVVGGYSNGDIRLFDLRKPAGCLWATELPGGVTSLEVGEGRLVGATVTGGLHLWDLATRHPEFGYCRTDSKVEGGCLWQVAACPQAPALLAAASQAGCLQLVGHEAPLAATVESSDGMDVGIPGHLIHSTNTQLADRPVTSLSWSPDKAGLLAATSFDQTLRVCLATNLPT